MSIALNVKELTFKKHLVKMGYNYKIKQYDDFIKSVKRTVQNELLKSLNEGNLTDKIEEIFIDDVKMKILENKNQIKEIRKTYFKKILDEGLLDLYLTDNIRKYSKDIQETAYINEALKDIDFTENVSAEKFFYNKEKYKKLKDTNSSKYISSLSCINSNGININTEEKENIIDTINKDIKDSCIRKDSRYGDILYILHTHFKLLEFPGKKDLHNFLLEKGFPEDILKNKIKVFNTNLLLNRFKRAQIKMIFDDINRNYHLNKSDVLTDLEELEIKGFDFQNYKNMKSNEFISKRESPLLSLGYYEKLVDLNRIYPKKNTKIFSLEYNGVKKEYSLQDIIDFKDNK